MIRPDLKSHNVNYMYFHSALVVPDGHISKIHKISPPDRDGDSLFAEYYDNKSAWVWITRPRKPRTGHGKKVNIHFNYVAGQRMPETKGAPKISELMELLASIGEELDFHCRLDFQFERSLAPKPVITLPIRFTTSPFMPFDTIVGLRLAKMDRRRRKYDIVLEALPKGDIRASLHFDHANKIGDSLPEAILQQGVLIIDKVVSRR